MKKYSALIIDDDIENINLLKIYLKKYCPMIDVVAQAINVNEGVRAYVRTDPEILLLDIELENDTIFSFIDTIGKNDKEIIFISSHPEFGVKAVNYNITGFIVKPIKEINLKKIISKAIFNIENNCKEKLLDYPIKIAIPSVNNIQLISVDSILYLEADGKYTIFHLKNNVEKVASRNLGEYEKLLDPKKYFRIHHRFLVNIDAIANIHKSDGYYCELINGKNLTIAKRRQELFNKFLKLK